MKCIIEIEGREAMGEKIAEMFRGCSYGSLSHWDKKRVAVSIDWIENNYRGDGLNGCLFELWDNPPLSHCLTVKGRGENDISVKYQAEGKGVRYYRAENKSNCGRVSSLLEGDGSRFVVYRLFLEYDHKGKRGKELWDVPAVIIPTDLLLAYWEQNPKALRHVKKGDEMQIQARLKPWFKALQEWPVPFIAGHVYTDTDFDGLVFGE